MILEKEKRQLIQVSSFRNMFYDLVENGLIRILFELKFMIYQGLRRRK